MRNNKEIRDLQRINRETQERFKALPVRNVPQVSREVPWIQVVGPHSLNSSPSIIGIAASAIVSWVDPGALNPGACDPVTGAQTVAATGSFTQSLGLGVGNIRFGNGPWKRVLVRNSFVGYDAIAGQYFMGAAFPSVFATEITAGQPTTFWRLMSP